MDQSKRFANRGVERNKKPLQNILYWFEDAKDGGYQFLWAYERDYNRHPNSKNWSGIITEDQIKARLTPSQWSKFRQGERHFVHQRRVNGRNIPKKVA